MKLMNRLRRSVVAWAAKQLTLSGVDGSRGWFRLFGSGDFNTGSWQQDRELTKDEVIAFAPVYSCVTLIASDIGKICLRLMGVDGNIWSETFSAAFSPVLRKPNHFQTRQQFIECWIISKLLHGNAYILKQRDARNVVVALYVLDPARVTPLVATDGSVYYQLQRDDLCTVHGDYPAVPAREIIHDRAECLFHPLVGISPLYAANLSATQGFRIQKNSERFFKNMSRPGGLLTAPGTIDDPTATRLKTDFEQKFSGENIGKLLVGGDGLTFNALTIDAEHAQLVEQLKLTAEQVCSTFHVPAYMIGAGQAPSYDNVEALNQQYYSQCLQKLFNAVEDLIDDGLGLQPRGYRVEFDLEDLLRMDPVKQAEVMEKLSKAAIMAPDEGRARLGWKPVPGGASPLAQQQNFSLAALAKRDAKDDPFETAPKPAPAPAPAPAEEDQTDKALLALFRKAPEELIHA
jgi:HK97 family phage portal protein